MQNEGRGSDLSQGPLVEDYKDWIEWRGHRVSMPNWWQELGGIPGISNLWELAWKIGASFEIPQVRSEAQDVENNYSAPPSPKCIHQKEFLPLQTQCCPARISRRDSFRIPCLCKSPTVWGREVQPTSARLTMPFGEVHARIKEGDRTICGFL